MLSFDWKTEKLLIMGINLGPRASRQHGLLHGNHPPEWRRRYPSIPGRTCIQSAYFPLVWIEDPCRCGKTLVWGAAHTGPGMCCRCFLSCGFLAYPNPAHVPLQIYISICVYLCLHLYYYIWNDIYLHTFQLMAALLTIDTYGYTHNCVRTSTYFYTYISIQFIIQLLNQFGAKHSEKLLASLRTNSLPPQKIPILHGDGILGRLPQEGPFITRFLPPKSALYHRALSAKRAL